MPASAYLKQELEKKEKRRKKDQSGASAKALSNAQQGLHAVRQPEGNEGSRDAEEQLRMNGVSISNESAGAMIHGGSVPEADNEHLRGLRGDNNGSLGAWTHTDGEDTTYDTVTESLDKASYTVKAGGDRAVFTPAHYAAYLKLWGSPAKAVQYYTRYLELKEMKKTGGLSEDDVAELDMLERMEKLALEFEDARHYMQEKRAYSQQDIDYAFSQNRHRKDGSLSSMFGTAHEAAGVYQCFFLDGVFGGMKEKYLKSEKDGGISEEAVRALEGGRSMESLQGMKQWLDKYLSDCVKKQRRGMMMIMRAILRSDPKHTRATVMQFLENVLGQVYFRKEFVVTNTDMRMIAAERHMPYAIRALLRDPSCRFTQMIRVILERLLAETV